MGPVLRGRVLEEPFAEGRVSVRTVKLRTGESAMKLEGYCTIISSGELTGSSGGQKERIRNQGEFSIRWCLGKQIVRKRGICKFHVAFTFQVASAVAIFLLPI